MNLDISEINKRLNFLEDLLSCHSQFYIWSYDAQGYLLNTNCDKLIINKIFLVSESFTYLMEYSQKSTTPLIMSSKLGLMWAAVFESHKDGRISRIHILGPTFLSRPTSSQIEQSLLESNVSLDWKSKLFSIFQDIPVVTITSFFQQTLMLHYCVTGEKLGTSVITFQKSEMFSGKTSLPEEKHDRMHVYMAEQAMLHMVREGNLNYNNALDKVVNVSTGSHIMTGKALTKAQISQVIFITLCSRAAIEGGVLPDVAYSRSDAYIQDVMNCTTVTEAAAIGHAMYDDFIHMVHNCRKDPKVSKQIQSCCDYIEQHVEEKLTLPMLAKRIGYADYYLSRKFKEETGLSINNYIKYAKIKQAKLLLATTQDSIQSISDGLNFSTRSFFADSFKHIVGVAPATYRQQNQRL